MPGRTATELTRELPVGRSSLYPPKAWERESLMAASGDCYGQSPMINRGTYGQSGVGGTMGVTSAGRTFSPPSPPPKPPPTKKLRALRALCGKLPVSTQRTLGNAGTGEEDMDIHQLNYVLHEPAKGHGGCTGQSSRPSRVAWPGVRPRMKPLKAFWQWHRPSSRFARKTGKAFRYSESDEI